MLTKKPFEIHAYSKSQMAEFYGVSTKTFSRWLEPLREKCPDLFPPKEKDHAHIYTPKQVKMIVEHLDLP